MEDNTESSETTDSTPTVEESESQPESTGAEQSVSAPEKAQEEKPVEPPFHEHPRFQELIRERQEARQREEKYQQDMYRLQAQLETLKEQSKPKVEQPKEKFLADLEAIDPSYAKYLQSVQQQAAKSEALEQRLQQFEQQQFAEKAVAHFNKLLDDSKITDPMDRKIVKYAVTQEVTARESQGQKLSLKDLDKITSDFYSEYKNTMESRERAITAKYVQTKTQDKAQAPKGATGGAAVSSVAKKLKGNDFSGQAKWLADQIRAMKKEH